MNFMDALPSERIHSEEATQCDQFTQHSGKGKTTQMVISSWGGVGVEVFHAILY